MDADTDIPISAANLDAITLSYDRLTSKGRETSLKNELSVPDDMDRIITMPETATAGWYRFILSLPATDSTWSPMEVLVADFTPATFNVKTDINAKTFQPGDQMRIETKALLHSGGPYADASATVIVEFKNTGISSDDPTAAGFHFDTTIQDTPSENQTMRTEGVLDENGSLITTFTLPEGKILYGRLRIGSGVMDDRGKQVANTVTAGYAARDRFVGIKARSWVLQKDKPGEVDFIVVDQEGKVVTGVPATVRLERRETVASDKKNEEPRYKWVEAETHEVESIKGPVRTSFTPRASGLYRITASIRDSKGREQTTSLEMFAVGTGQVLWEDNNKEKRLEIVPEKTGYKVGETARYLVKNPFPGAKALITIERYGIIKHWVQTLDTSTPVIEFKVEKEFIPGYFLSVVVMTGRTDKPFTEKQGDLGHPAFRMGYAVATVDDPYNELTIEASPAKETYRPGDKVRVALHVSHQKEAVNEPVELAVAVLDDAVFDLITGGRGYFDPYKGFYTLDRLDVTNFNILRHLVGRQRFGRSDSELKSTGEFTLEEINVTAVEKYLPVTALYDIERVEVNYGEETGKSITLRTNFKYLAYWNPSIITDAQGDATIEFDAPDNLTGWHVIVMAVTPTNRMGLGEGHFPVNKPTEIQPVMPNQVTEGDAFQAGFSIMNRTDKGRELTMTITAEGAIETGGDKKVQEITKTVTADPYKRTIVWLPLTAKGDGKIKFTARGGDSTDQDGVVHEIEVRKMASLETAATYGSFTSENAKVSLQFPDNIRTDVGKVSVNLSPTVIGNLEGAFKYLRDYPYIC